MTDVTREAWVCVLHTLERVGGGNQPGHHVSATVLRCAEAQSMPEGPAERGVEANASAHSIAERSFTRRALTAPSPAVASSGDGRAVCSRIRLSRDRLLMQTGRVLVQRRALVRAPASTCAFVIGSCEIEECQEDCAVDCAVPGPRGCRPSSFPRWRARDIPESDGCRHH